MRRVLIGVTLACIALAVAIVWAQPGPPPLSYIPRIVLTMRSQFDPAGIDRNISVMDCRIVTKERLSDDRFLLTEECTWKSGRVERRRFLALRKDDGPVQGWMYRLAQSDT